MEVALRRQEDICSSPRPRDRRGVREKVGTSGPCREAESSGFQMRMKMNGKLTDVMDLAHD